MQSTLPNAKNSITNVHILSLKLNSKQRIMMCAIGSISIHQYGSVFSSSTTTYFHSFIRLSGARHLFCTSNPFRTHILWRAKLSSNVVCLWADSQSNPSFDFQRFSAHNSHRSTQLGYEAAIDLHRTWHYVMFIVYSAIVRNYNPFCFSNQGSFQRWLIPLSFLLCAHRIPAGINLNHCLMRSQFFLLSFKKYALHSRQITALMRAKMCYILQHNCFMVFIVP